MNRLSFSFLSFSVLLSFLAFPHLLAGPFPENAPALVEGEQSTVRGVINLVVFPVPDDFEMEPVQSAYALITPIPLEASGTDSTGEEIHETGLTLFHLAGDDEITAQFDALAGRPVEMTVDLMPAHTRHHRTPFLLLARSIRAL